MTYTHVRQGDDEPFNVVASDGKAWWYEKGTLVKVKGTAAAVPDGGGHAGGARGACPPSPPPHAHILVYAVFQPWVPGILTSFWRTRDTRTFRPNAVAAAFGLAGH